MCLSEFSFVIQRLFRSKNLFSESCSECPITLGWTPFHTPSAILGPPGGHFGFCRRLYVSHRRSALIKQPILQELFGVPNNLGLNTFSDPVCHFWPLGSHFGFYRQLYVSHRRSAHIKNPILQKLFGAPNNYRQSFWGPL